MHLQLRASHVAAGLAIAAIGGSFVGTSPATARLDRAPSTVTIQSEGTDIFGTVKSTRRACKNERKVLLFKVLGGSPGGGDDSLFASDTTELQNGVGVWNTGNLGTEGRFYAKVRRTALCKGDTSPVIQVTANP